MRLAAHLANVWLATATTAAYAYDPPMFIEGRLHGGSDTPAGSDIAGAGAGFGFAVGVHPNLAIEVDVDAGLLSRRGVRLSSWLAVRAFGTEPGTTPVTFSALLGGGMAFAPGNDFGTRPLVLLGAAVDSRLATNLALRVEGDVLSHLIAAEPLAGARVGLGVVVTFPTRAVVAVEPEPEPEPEPHHEPEPAPPRLGPQPPGTLVWVPHPVCEWVLAEEAEELFASLEDGDVVQVTAPGYLPAVVAPGGPAFQLQPAPKQGGVLIVASPGDELELGEAVRPVSPDGVGVVNAQEGVADIRVVGGGRSELLTVPVADGMASWIRIDPPVPVRITFGAGSSSLDDAARARLAILAANTRGWRWAVHGSASPEGDATFNQALAVARATAAADVLQQSGVSPNAIDLGEPRPPEPGLPYTEQRAVVLTPLPPTGAP